MPKVGVEPTRAYAHYALNVARLPIPPLRHAQNILPQIPGLSTCVHVVITHKCGKEKSSAQMW